MVNLIDKFCKEHLEKKF